MKPSRLPIATFLAAVFHFCGLVGILFTPYKDWFVAHTAFTLLVMVALLVWTQPEKKAKFFIFILLAFLVGMSVEMIGVNTGKLFGTYHYGNLMGAKLNGVPWLIGLNWFVVVFCSASIMQLLHEWTVKKFLATDFEMPLTLSAFSLIIDGALLACFFDWLMEPVAGKLGFWEWKNNEIPFYNYLCWFLISMGLLFVFHKFLSVRTNHFAVHLFIIQALFFLALRTFLP
jgi:bisanhydrobacterioruberin hydratase